MNNNTKFINRGLSLQFAKQTPSMSLSSTALEQKNFLFLHVVQEAMNAFNSVLHGFGFSQKLEPYDPKKHPTKPTSFQHSKNYQPGFPC